MKKIVFLTGTRADFGKLKPLIARLCEAGGFDVHIFTTGMHMNPKFGRTADEVIKSGYGQVFMYYNHDNYDSMDVVLSKTIVGFSHYIKDIRPDLIVIHGDRVEALACAIVGALNNYLVAHIEGGEVSGTIDESIRHSISKLSHIHFVCNDTAKSRLLQMGESTNSIFVIGSPDVDIMISDKLPALDIAKKRYDIPYADYSILLFHPVTTEFDQIEFQIDNLVSALLKSEQHYIVIYPNNDHGSDFILSRYLRLQGNPNFRLFPSIRFEYFLTLLGNANFIIGNSSAGIREAPYYGVPTVNIGSRQNRRESHPDIINSGYKECDISNAIQKASKQKVNKISLYGDGNSADRFIESLSDKRLWEVNKQKYFMDRPNE